MGTLASALGSIIPALVDAPRVYADANLPAGSIAFMRRELRWDVLFVLEDEAFRRAADEVHYARALDLGRTLVTLDFDFSDDRRFPPDLSPGVIICSAPDEAGLRRLLRHADRTWLRDPSAPSLPLKGRKITLTPDLR
jgi:hypothetical protein